MGRRRCNLIDSDGIPCPTAGNPRACALDPSRLGINPLNGSDAFENPDGDGYDVNHDGVLSADEAFVNYLEYYIRSDLFSGNQTLDGVASLEISPPNSSTTSAT